jgi:hypothetical protein
MLEPTFQNIVTLIQRGEQMLTAKKIKIIKRAERNASRALGGDKRSIVSGTI